MHGENSNKDFPLPLTGPNCETGGIMGVVR